MMEPKYLKVYEGVITGSMAGRDDGYPCDYEVFYHTIEELAKDYGKKKKERYYSLTPLSGEQFEAEIAEALNQTVQKEKEKKKQSIKDEIARLQKKLNELK